MMSDSPCNSKKTGNCEKYAFHVPIPAHMELTWAGIGLYKCLNRKGTWWNRGTCGTSPPGWGFPAYEPCPPNSYAEGQMNREAEDRKRKLEL